MRHNLKINKFKNYNIKYFYYINHINYNNYNNYNIKIKYIYIYNIYKYIQSFLDTYQYKHIHIHTKMPRERRGDNDKPTLSQEDVEEDYLDVDKPISGQNFYCVSFVSPEKILEQKDKFMFYHYERAVNKKVSSMLDEGLTSLIDKSEDGNVDVANVITLKKSIETTCKEYDLTFEQFKDKFEDFKFSNEEKIGEAFDKANNFRTSMRGVKMRGVYDTKREADTRAAVLQRQDPLFDVFVGQVGYWCPWDPNPQKIADIEYMNNDLNKLVKEYKSNEAKKDMFYQEQKTQRQKDALSAEDRLKHQEGIDKTNAIKTQMQEQQSLLANQSSPSLTANTSNLNNAGTNFNSLLNMSDASNKNTNTNTIEEALTGFNNTEAQIDLDLPQHSITQSLELGGENSKEITFDEASAQLLNDDPWLQRKIAEKSII